MREDGGGGFGVSAIEYSCAHWAQINFGDLTPYLTYNFTLFNFTTERRSKQLFWVSVHIYAARLVIYLSSEYVFLTNYSEFFKASSLFLSIPTKYV